MGQSSKSYIISKETPAAGHWTPAVFPVLLQVVLLLDPSWTTTSCTNSATPPRCWWTGPRGQKRAAPATASQATCTSTWCGEIQAARTTNWFSWRYVGPESWRAVTASQTPVDANEFLLKGLQREDRACARPIWEERHPAWIQRWKRFGEKQTSSADQAFLDPSEEWKGEMATSVGPGSL